MKFTFDRYRILHLILLMACSYIVAETLIAKMEWSKLSAYGFACTVITQLNNAINPIESDDSKHTAAEETKKQDKRERILEKRRERRKGVANTKRE